MKDEKLKVVRVTRTEFELSNGRVYQHNLELDEVPTIEKFQEIYDRQRSALFPEDGSDTANYS